MLPFDVSSALDELNVPYPLARAIVDAARNGDQDARYAIARLWLSEGIPYAFRARPAVYEAVRIWLARKLDVKAKEITLIGSGRQGVSLSPGPTLGRAFGPHSDLDLSVISLELFERLRRTFERWADDYHHRAVHPRNPREEQMWDANIRHATAIRRGFIDPHKIPTWDRYPEAKTVGQATYLLQEKLKLTTGAPAVRAVSLRVYRGWDAFTRQLAINLEYSALRSIPEQR